MAITIGWKGEDGRKWPERLDIDPDHLDVASIEKLEETKQWSPYAEVFIYWKVKCSLEEREDGHREISVNYTEGQQDDENILNDISRNETKHYFGENRIIVERDLETGQWKTDGYCTWHGEDPVEIDDSIRWKAMRPRLRVTREQWERESRFRDKVLDMDGRCVISREKTRAVLDAAHLRPVEEGGEDLVENGFILRTDIHRLYDRGMFLINPNDGTLVIDKNLSKYYKELLCRSRLPNATLKRVREALQERWTQPQP